MTILFESDRDFEFWDYSVSHKQLLIRSPRFRGKHNNNLDIVFVGVDKINSFSGFNGLTIIEIVTEEKSQVISNGPLPKDGKLFLLLDKGSSNLFQNSSLYLETDKEEILRRFEIDTKSFIHAHSVDITENSYDINITSLKGMGKPDIA